MNHQKTGWKPQKTAKNANKSFFSLGLPISRFNLEWTTGCGGRNVGRVTGISGNKNFLVSCALLLFASIILGLAQSDPKALSSEKVFITALHNSLWNLDVAKFKWIKEKNKSEHDVPTMLELSPYLGEWTNHIARLETLGINYKITALSEMEPQSDVATLTRDIYFHAGICRYYPAGTRYCLHTGWTNPELNGASKLLAFYFANRELLAIAIIFLTTVNLLVLGAIKLFRKIRAR